MTTDTAKALGRLGAPTITVSLDEFRGHLAQWAVRLSPYPQGPDGLSEVLLEINQRFGEKGGFFVGVWLAEPARVALEAWVQEMLDIPMVKAWGELDHDGNCLRPSTLASNITSSILAEDDILAEENDMLRAENARLLAERDVIGARLAAMQDVLHEAAASLEKKFAAIVTDHPMPGEAL